MKKLFSILLLTALSIASYATEKTVSLRFIETSDVHGSFFPYDFINRRDKKGSLARVSSYVNEMRKKYGKNVILLDNGDILQGQPTCYYCNFVKPTMPRTLAAHVYRASRRVVSHAHLLAAGVCRALLFLGPSSAP